MSRPFVPIETANVVWRDGLPFSPTFDAIYFASKNGLDAAKHVFIEGNKLIERWQNLAKVPSGSFVIGETGFGSGLNFLLTWSLWVAHAPRTSRLHFISCEKFPLTKVDLVRCLNLWPQLETYAKMLIKNYPILTPGFHYLQFEEGRITLTLMLGDAISSFKQLLLCGDLKLEQQLRVNHVDAWFLDSFPPLKNQAMWIKDLLQILGLLSKPSTTLASFSVASLLKENLQKVGFAVTKAKGYGSKPEMMVAQFRELKLCNKKLRFTPWHIGRVKPYSTKKAMVVGAGLAGCYTAHALAKRGWQVMLIDAQKDVAQGASGNRQAVLYPQISAYYSPLTIFMQTAFLYAQRVYKPLLKDQLVGDLSGILQLACNEKERAFQESLRAWLCIYPELGILVNAQQASVKAGIALDVGGLFIPNSGWLDAYALCQVLRQTPGIHWLPNKPVAELIFQNEQWHIGDQSAPVLIIANGYQAKQFSQTAHLPLQLVRGQMTMIATNQSSEKLKIPLCSEGHVLPAYKGMQAVGASYQLDCSDTESYFGDDLSNLSRLTKIPTKIAWSNEIKKNWVGLRAATTDYLPLVGPVPDANIFRSRFSSLATDAKRWVSASDAYLPGLFLCAGFGSKGLTTIPLSAEWLASLISNEPSHLPYAMVQSLSPARFLRKDIIKNIK